MDPDTIRAMDGEALTRLAVTLGLAPPDLLALETVEPAWRHTEGTGAPPWLYHDTRTHRTRVWAPHAHLDQADAVFRRLRAWGFVACLEWCALARPPCGEVYACLPGGGAIWECTFYETDGAAGEALALLRVSVLAIASLPQEAPHAE